MYVLALLLREALGDEDTEELVGNHFHSMPRALVTVFRCSLGDCSSASGTPIFETISNRYGVQYGMAYCVMMFCVSLGMCNVISSIFVESTMTAAIKMKQATKHKRLSDVRLWTTSTAQLIKRIMQFAGYNFQCPLQPEDVDIMYEVEIPLEIMEELISDAKAQEALASLDVEPADAEFLGSLLDPDNGGSLRIIEIVDGVGRLRGEPRRGDQLTVDLMLRSLQRTVYEFIQEVKECNPAMRSTFLHGL